MACGKIAPVMSGVVWWIVFCLFWARRFCYMSLPVNFGSPPDYYSGTCKVTATYPFMGWFYKEKETGYSYLLQYSYV